MSESAGQGMGWGGSLTNRIVSTVANVVLLGVARQPPCHMVKTTLDAIWQRVKSMLSMINFRHKYITASVKGYKINFSYSS